MYSHYLISAEQKSEIINVLEDIAFKLCQSYHKLEGEREKKLEAFIFALDDYITFLKTTRIIYNRQIELMQLDIALRLSSLIKEKVIYG